MKIFKTKPRAVAIVICLLLMSGIIYLLINDSLTHSNIGSKVQTCPYIITEGESVK